MRRLMGMRGIRVGMPGTKVGMPGIRMVMPRMGVGMWEMQGMLEMGW